MTDPALTADVETLRAEVRALHSERASLLAALRDVMSLAEPRRHGVWVPSSAYLALLRAAGLQEPGYPGVIRIEHPDGGLTLRGAVAPNSGTYHVGEVQAGLAPKAKP